MKQVLQQRIQAGFEAYHQAVLKMSDVELYAHVFDDGDFKEDDFAFQELKKRGIDQFRPCHACQGGGCPVCNGFGQIPTFL